MVKPYNEILSGTSPKDPPSEAAQNTVNSISSQITQWDGKPEYQGHARRHPLPNDSAYSHGRTTHCGPRLQQGRGPEQNRTNGLPHGGNTLQQPSNTVTMVTATASVTVSVHPNLPGSYQGTMHEVFEDSVSDSFENSERTSQTYGRANQPSKRDSLQLQDLESLDNNQHQAKQGLGKVTNHWYNLLHFKRYQVILSI